MGKKNCLFNYQMCVLCILDKKGCCTGYIVQIFPDQHLKQHFGCWLRLADKFGQPHPLQVLCFSHRGIREMWVTGDKAQGTMGRWGFGAETVESLLTATIFYPIRQKIHTLTLVLNLSTAATFFHPQGGHCREVQQHWKGAEQASSKCETKDFESWTGGVHTCLLPTEPYFTL